MSDPAELTLTDEEIVAQFLDRTMERHKALKHRPAHQACRRCVLAELLHTTRALGITCDDFPQPEKDTPHVV